MPTVLITGAGRGLGKGFADHYAAAGWRVISTARNPEGLAGEAYPLEVTSAESVAALAKNVALSDRKLMVFISSMMGSITQTHSSDSIFYRSSKACLNQAVNVMSHDLKSQGIACVLFHPGWVRTDMGGAGAAIDVNTSIRGMTNVIDRLGFDDNGRFINYDGFDIPW